MTAERKMMKVDIHSSIVGLDKDAFNKEEAQDSYLDNRTCFYVNASAEPLTFFFSVRNVFEVFTVWKYGETSKGQWKSRPLSNKKRPLWTKPVYSSALVLKCKQFSHLFGYIYMLTVLMLNIFIYLFNKISMNLSLCWTGCCLELVKCLLFNHNVKRAALIAQSKAWGFSGDYAAPLGSVSS